MAATGANGIELDYRDRVVALTKDEQRLQAADKRLTQSRVAIFVLLIFVLAASYPSEAPRPWYFAAAAVFFGFVAVVGWHDRVYRLLDETRLKRLLYQRGISRRQRCWRDLPIVEISVPSSARATADDLDLFGPSSLFQLASPASTGIGHSTLRDWMVGDWVKHDAEDDELRARQEAVAELAAKPTARERLQLLASQLTAGKTGPVKFMEWAEGDRWLLSRPWLRWVVLTMPLIAAGALGVFLLGLVAPSLAVPTVAGLAFIGAIAVNAMISVFFTGPVHEIFLTVSSRNGEAAKYLDMFREICAANTESIKLRSLQSELADGQVDVMVELGQLRRTMLFANISRSPLLFLLLYVPLQLVALWDFHCLWRLEKWQTRNSKNVRKWFRALGQFETLAGLATLAAEHPDWTFPTVDPGTDTIVAKNLGHPLLADDVRVGNDVQVGPAGSVLLVTGSNMSGKSTLLRSLGINAILAKIGAPVCAAELSMPPVEVAASMRVQDSLADGVSFFMAELRRLKEIVDLAHVCRAGVKPRLLYLLDEILQGTNSRERQIAVNRVIRHLLDCQAIGAISTHDIELASSDGLIDACRSVHFREVLEDDSPQGMSFDYVMHHGIAKTTNALKLLALVGLDEDLT